MSAVGSVLLPADTAVPSPVPTSSIKVLLADDAFSRTNPDVEAALRATVERMVATNAIAEPERVTAAPPGRDLLQWWDESFRVLQGVSYTWQTLVFPERF